MWCENTWTNKSPNSSVVQTLLLQISTLSQNWADKIAKEGTIRHNEVGLQQNQAFYNAENIADTPNVTRAVDFFYNEIKQWDFDNPVFSYATNHFMHMIWKNAKKVGVGCAGSMVRSNNISFFSSSVASSIGCPKKNTFVVYNFGGRITGAYGCPKPPKKISEL